MWKTAFLRGTVAAIAAAAVAWAVATRGLDRIYYLAVLLPSEALLFLALSWFLHLRDDGFFKQPGRLKSRPRDLVPRQGEREEPRDERVRERRGTRTFLVAALELALLATALYFAAGVGSSYFL